MREKLAELAFDKAVNAVAESGLEWVMFKSGVWNSYERVRADYAIQRIRNSGYGADVYRENDMIYVCCPCSSDMW